MSLSAVHPATNDGRAGWSSFLTSLYLPCCRLESMATTERTPHAYSPSNPGGFPKKGDAKKGDALLASPLFWFKITVVTLHRRRTLTRTQFGINGASLRRHDEITPILIAPCPLPQCRRSLNRMLNGGFLLFLIIPKLLTERPLGVRLPLVVPRERCVQLHKTLRQ